MTKRNLIWAVTLLAVAVILLLTRKPAYPPSQGDEVQLHFRPLIETYRLIQQEGYRPNDDRELLRGAVGGMASAADEYASYIPPEEVAAFRRRMEGFDRGVGLRVERMGRQFRLHRVDPGSPASHAGLRPGDALLAVDERELESLTAAQVDRLINEGPVGSTVELTVAGLDERVETVSLARQEYSIESVVGLWRRPDGRWHYRAQAEPSIAYVRVKEFIRPTAEDIQVALRQVDAPEGVVLDLRNNPGGQFPAATATADLFLRGGKIVTLVDNSGEGRPHIARPEGTYPGDLRLVVLVNAQTASAAELVAGALAFNHRAVLVGTRTQGKGAIQGMFQLPDGMGELNLTTSEFLLGDGQSISRRADSDRWGLDPHVEVKLSPAESRRLWQLRSQLETDHPVEKASKSPLASAKASELAETVLAVDHQLRMAVELLANPEDFDAVLHRPYTATAPHEDKAE